VALEEYRKDFPNDSRAAEVAFQLGDLDEAAGKLDEAMKEFQTALAGRPAASLTVELYYRVGRLHEQKGETTAALRAYENAMASPDRDHPYRLSAVARSAALYEAKKDYPRALAAYRDIMRNAKDPELVAAAEDRATALSRGR
jgi:tetratricopeptide (TPR) repeat protein